VARRFGVDRGADPRIGLRQRVERIGGTAPLQRPGEADEIARTILWLASDEASYITGALLDISGGR